MAEITKELGRIPVSRGNYQATTEYYKDNIVQYKRGSYQVVSESPIIGIPPTNDKNIVNPGWTLFAGTLDAQDVVNQIKEQEAQSIQAVAAREAEILIKSDAALISSTTVGLEGSNVEEKLASTSNKLTIFNEKIIGIETDTDSLKSTVSNMIYNTVDDTELPTLCGQPPILFGEGSPQEAVVPYNWRQFDPETGDGYNWNGEPSAIGQQYIDVTAKAGGRYIAIQTADYELIWKNF